MATKADYDRLEALRAEYRETCERLNHAVTFGTQWRVAQLRKYAEELDSQICDLEERLNIGRDDDGPAA